MWGAFLLILLDPLDGQAADVSHAGFRAIHINVQLHVLAKLAHEVQASLVVGPPSAYEDLHPGSLDVVRLLCHGLCHPHHVLQRSGQALSKKRPQVLKSMMLDKLFPVGPD